MASTSSKSFVTGRGRPTLHGWRKPFSLSIWLISIGLRLTSVYSQSANYTVEVCPSALWKDAIFLAGPSSPATFANVTKWKQEQAQDYVTKTVLPQVRANLVFVIMAIVALVVFLLWRLFRRCCMCCCMRQSCEDKRKQADPKKILSGCGYWFQKILLVVVALAALAMMIAGIVMAPKELFVKVWKPVDNLTAYLSNTTVRMDDLVAGLSGVNPILNNLTAIVNNDVNIPYLRANLQNVQVTLAISDANPATVATAFNSLEAGMSSVRSDVAALRPQLSPSSGLPANLTTLQAGLPGLSTVVATCTDYSSRLDDLNTELQSLSGSTGPLYDTTDLEAAMAAVQVASWNTSLTTMTASLDVWSSFRAGNTLARLATDLTALSTGVDELKSTLVPDASDSLTAFYSAWTSVKISLQNLLDRITHVQATVAQLDVSSTAAVNRLRSVQGNLTALDTLQPPPATLASNLSALAGELALGPVSALVNDLNSVQAAIDAVPLATLNDARATLGNLKTSLESLSPKFAATSSAVATYNASQTQANFDAMKSSAVATGNTWELSVAAKTKADVAVGNSSVSAVAIAASSTSLISTSNDVKSGAGAVDSSVAAADTSVASRPALSPYLGRINGVKSVYDSMPTPKTKELDPVFSALNTIESLLKSIPDSVRSQTASVQRSFGSGVDQLERKVINRTEKFKQDNEDHVNDYDLARYRATCVLLGVASFFVVLMIVFAAINCPWGIGCAIVFLLVLAALLFVLAIVFAAVLVGAQDGCYHSERVVLDALGPGSTVTPLANFYFFANINASVKDTLKAADLVDIDRVTQQVTDQANALIVQFTAQFSPQPKLAAVITDLRGFINTTLDDVNSLLDLASARQVRPLYMDLKSYPCCEVAGYSAELWVVLTFGGWLLMMTANLAMALLGRLDQLPQSGCCGCKPLIGKRLENQVKPAKEGETDEGAVKAMVVAPQEQTMPAVMPAAAPQPYMAYSQPSAPPLPPDYPPTGHLAADPTYAPYQAAGFPVNQYPPDTKK